MPGLPKTAGTASPKAPKPELPSKAEVKRQVDAIYAQLHPAEAPKGTHQAPASLDGFLNLVRPFLATMSKAKLMKIVAIILGMDD